MEAEKFLQMAIDNTNFDYGMCPPLTKAQEGLNVLIHHFLGDDWYVVMPLSTEQVNTEAIYEILRNYPKKKSLKTHFKDLLLWILGEGAK